MDAHRQRIVDDLFGLFFIIWWIRSSDHLEDIAHCQMQSLTDGIGLWVLDRRWSALDTCRSEESQEGSFNELSSIVVYTLHTCLALDTKLANSFKTGQLRGCLSCC